MLIEDSFYIKLYRQNCMLFIYFSCVWMFIALNQMGIVGRVYAGGIWYGILITYDPQAAKRQASRTMAREAQE